MVPRSSPEVSEGRWCARGWQAGGAGGGGAERAARAARAGARAGGGRVVRTG